MFEHHSLLSKILYDKFDFIFVDEHQDTQRAVANIFLEHIKENATKRLCLGFFGDKKQSIYDTGIVDIQAYVDNGQVTEIIKTDNYRCSQKVITVLNQVRDDLTQQPAKKDAEGKIANKEGSATFIYSDNAFDLSVFEKTEYVNGWDFSNAKKQNCYF